MKTTRERKKMVFIELPGGRLKRLGGRIGGNKSQSISRWDDDWDGKPPIPEKSQVGQVVTKTVLLGFNIPPTRLVAACYNGNGHIVLRDEVGKKFNVPLRRHTA